MTPTPEQIRAAVANRHRPPRTAAARVMDALAHVRKSPKERAGMGTGPKAKTHEPAKYTCAESSDL
jgi:hypothetical protein